MVRMILADDEPVITKGIQKLVDFKSLGIEIVGEYEDGKAALDGILMEKPDIALLDIYMPKKTGIDILKELKQLGVETKVIFISGFQDFQYAKDALTYGAVDYLLKPVIREELVSTLEKCIRTLLPAPMEEELETETEDGLPSYTPFDRLVEVEECEYLPVFTEILHDRVISPQEEKLIRFSVIGYLENMLNEREAGIVFVKNNRIVLVLKNPKEPETGQILYELMEQAEESMHCRLGFITGEPVESMGEIPKAYEKCLSMEGYLYFAEKGTIPIIRYGEKVYARNATLEDIKDCRQSLMNAMVAQDEDEFEKAMVKLKRTICTVADGRKDDACFHYGSTIRIMVERFESMGVHGPELEFKEILEQARATKSYGMLTELFEAYFRQYKEQIRSTAANTDKKDIFMAKEYIENHYRENLSLEVLAGVVHMNPYYFSSFFKKSSGENFKDYLNKVRMKHALALLVSTDKKTGDIADEVGFRDGRAFSELFQRYYGETPSSYRKRMKRADA